MDASKARQSSILVRTPAWEREIKIIYDLPPFCLACGRWGHCCKTDSQPVGKVLTGGRTEGRQQAAKEVSQLQDYKLKLRMTNASSHLNNQLWIFWKEPSLTLIQTIECTQIIHCQINSAALHSPLWISSVYGRHTRAERANLWNAISSWNVGMDPWILGGDFNCIHSLDQHKGNCNPCYNSVEDFRECMEASNLLYIHPSGGHFSWSGKRSQGKLWRRLDHIFGNQHLMDRANRVHLSMLSKGASDHMPFLLELSIDTYSGPKPFRFLDLWEAESRASRAQDHFEANPNPESLVEFNKSNVELLLLSKRETDFWRQKSCIRWLKEGDASTKFFHNVVKNRRQKLRISSIKDDHGRTIEEASNIALHAIDYYTNIYSDEPVSIDPQLLSYIPNIINGEDNLMLCAVPQEEEIRGAIWDLNSHSAPGPDGYNGTFFKTYWHIIHDEVTRATQEFFLGFSEMLVAKILEDKWKILEGLPIHLFDSLALYSIGNLLGKPLKTDSATATLSRPSVARICVEIDTSKDLPRCVWIHLGELTFLQPITYEDLPDYCPSFKSLGHKNCKKKNENSRWVKTEGRSRTGSQQAVVFPKPGVTPITNEVVLQTNQGESRDEYATGSASAAEAADSYGAAPPRVEDMALANVRDSIAHEPPLISTALEIPPATSLRSNSDPIVCEDTDYVKKDSEATLSKSCTSACHNVNIDSDSCEVIPTANGPETCGNSEVILVTHTNVQDDTLILEPNSPLLYNDELSRGAHNLSSKAALEGTQTVDTENKEEYIPDPSQINLNEFPVLTKELLEATSGAHTLSHEKEMEGTLSLSSAGNDEIPSDPMENKNSPPLTNDAAVADDGAVVALGDQLQALRVDLDANTQRLINSIYQLQQDLETRIELQFQRLQTMLDAHQTGAGPGFHRPGPHPMVDHGFGGPDRAPPKPRLEAPICDGTEPLRSLYKVGEYFAFYNTPPEERLRCVALMLEGPAADWFRWRMNGNLIADYADFEEKFHLRFDPMHYVDYFGQLANLRQTGSVMEYQTAFEHILQHVPGTSEANLMSLFHAGLKPHLRHEIALLKPATLSASFALARELEAKHDTLLQSVTRRPYSWPSTPPSRPTLPADSFQILRHNLLLHDGSIKTRPWICMKFDSQDVKSIDDV
ncbi:unnamed protein product [Cuscuta campestris]|uniref:Retrotransposon gag domain-containing protein n=1 Tax=Cuscuta campestris TaxID=132261 RepID=A0A484KDX1_9ASTE|nr:unnamed protein product [Cuscuta campestris]